MPINIPRRLAFVFNKFLANDANVQQIDIETQAVSRR